MVAILLQRVYQQLVMLVIVTIILLATYVSIGRQFMPAISRYAGFLENQILASTGIPVAVDTLDGSFRGFNPVISIDGLQLAVVDDSTPVDGASGGLYFKQATIEVDMLRSLWQRRWVLQQFAIESLELELEQTAAGAWLLGGLDVAGDEMMDLGSLYQTFLSFSQLDLRDVVLNVRTRSGESLMFTEGLVTVQNQGDAHFLHIDAKLEQNPQQLNLSLEVHGNELADMEGRLYLALPRADYSALLTGQDLGGLAIYGLKGQGELWLDLAGGNLISARSSVNLDDLVLAVNDSNPLRFAEVRGTAAIARGLALDHWEVALSDMAAHFGDELWQSFTGYFYWVPGQTLSARADRMELALLRDLTLASGLLDQVGEQRLAEYAPGGSVRNFSLTWPLGTNGQPLRVRTNVLDARLGSVRGSPNMWGINGYLDLEFDPVSQRLSGLGELESDDFSINIPGMFTRVWDYGYANGRLFIDIELSDGVLTKLQSSTVVVESDAVDGRLRFASRSHRFPDGRREASLELLVGSPRVDARQAEVYLPDGPRVRSNLRTSMEFLERAIVAGDIHNSGILFRGNTVAGSPAVSRTFQSFFRVDRGTVNFSDQWPMLQQLSGLVVTDDNRIDLAVSEASSLGLELAGATGRIRRDGGGRSRLQLTGQARAATADGLAYLQQTPVDGSVRDALRTWEASGDLLADMELVIPLNQPDSKPEVRLELQLDNNGLYLPLWDLTVSDLSGPVIFDSRSGLLPTRLTATLFGGAAELQLASESASDNTEVIRMAASGRIRPAALAAWPGHGAWVRALLGRADGTLGYEAQLRTTRDGTGFAGHALTVKSDLVGVGLRLPQPLGKPPTQAMPLDLQLEFAAGNLQARAELGTELDLDVLIANGAVQQGTLTLGKGPGQVGVTEAELPRGLVIEAQLDQLDLQEWTELVTSLDSPGGGISDPGSQIARIEASTGLFSLYGRVLPAVDLHLVPDAAVRGWRVGIGGESVAGHVVVPYDGQGHLHVDLDYLQLPDNDPEQPPDSTAMALTPVGEESQLRGQQEQQRVDPLLGLDPRELPLMRFSVDDFAVGSRSYGSWQFDLVPTDHGAEFYALNFDFRGLRLGRDEPDQRIEVLQPHFRWLFDGSTHRSELAGVLVADDIGSVLEANGYAPSLESDSAAFVAELSWPGSPAFFSAEGLSGRIDLLVDDGRFLRNSGGQGALRLVSFINLTAVFQRLRFSDDLLRRGLAFDEISGRLSLHSGRLHIQDRLVISGPSSLYQITGDVDLAQESIEGELYVTLPVSDNLPWIGLLTANLPLAVGAYLFDQIFGEQVDSLSSAVYTLNGPLAGLEPEFKQAFGSPDSGSQQVPTSDQQAAPR